MSCKDPTKAERTEAFIKMLLRCHEKPVRCLSIRFDQLNPGETKEIYITPDGNAYFGAKDLEEVNRFIADMIARKIDELKARLAQMEETAREERKAPPRKKPICLLNEKPCIEPGKYCPCLRNQQKKDHQKHCEHYITYQKWERRSANEGDAENMLPNLPVSEGLEQ